MAQTTATLIQAKEIINGGFLKSVPISSSFNYASLVPHLKAAERRFLIDNDLFNKIFFTDLKAKVVNQVSQYNSALPGGVVSKYEAADALQIAYEALWTQELLSYLSFAVVYQALPFIELKIGNAGVSSLEGNLQTSAGTAGVKYLQDQLLQTLDSQARAIKDFICETPASYPLFDPDDNICEDCATPGDASSSSAGIVIY